MPNTTIDVEQLHALRAFHLGEVRRIDDAIALCRDVAKQLRTAGKTIDKVRARAAADNGEAEAPAKASRRSPEQRAKDAERARRNYRAKKRTGAKENAARLRAQVKAGTSPTDNLRRVFVEAGEKLLTRDDLMSLTDFEGIGGGPDSMGARGKAARVLGLTLSVLIRRKEIKKSGDGFVASRHLLNPDAASANGAHA